MTQGPGDVDEEDPNNDGFEEEYDEEYEDPDYVDPEDVEPEPEDDDDA